MAGNITSYADRRIDALTSLRFFAALAVVLFHIPATLPQLYGGKVFGAFSGGVDFFFVLSGYVLGLSYAGRSDFSAAEFYRRRFARIYPLYLLTMLVWSALFLETWSVSGQDKWNSGIAHLFLVHAFFAGAFYNLGFNAPAWTLSCEAFFYAVFPLFRRRGALAAAVVVVVADVILLRTYGDALDAAFPNFVGTFPPTAFWKFALGLALAQFWGSRQWQETPHATMLEALALSCVLFLLIARPLWGVEVYTIALNLACAFTIAVVARQAGAISCALRWRPLVLLGEASYGLYLWHYMLMAWISGYVPAGLDPITSFGSIVLVIAVTILLSIVTYLVFERTMRRWIVGGRRREAGEAHLH